MITSFQGTYRFLSNFWPVPSGIEMNGQTYKTVEHAYQAAKTDLLVERAAIRAVAKPGEAKRMGRKVTMRKGWDNIKLEVMLNLLRQKFSTKNQMLRLMLLETEPEIIQEGNYWHDYFWGMCNGRGENHLGRLLMQVRDEISKKEPRL